MKIEVKIASKEDYNEELDSGWSLPVPINDFILKPNEIEFKWENGDTLPYDDFIFFGDYYYRIYINGRPEKYWDEWFKGIDLSTYIENSEIL